MKSKFLKEFTSNLPEYMKYIDTKEGTITYAIMMATLIAAKNSQKDNGKEVFTQDFINNLKKELCVNENRKS